MVTLRFEVVGTQPLACERCEQRVERLLNALAGVAAVRADAQSQRIDVLFDPAVIPEGTIVGRLMEAGYETRMAV